MADYRVPLGIDSEQLVNPLNEAIDLIERTGQVAGEAGREISTGFANGGRAAAELDRSLAPLTGNLNEISQVSRRTQEGLNNAFNERNVNTNALLNKVNEFKQKLQAVEINKRIGIDVEPEAIQELELALRQMQQSFPAIQAELAQQVSFFENSVAQSRDNIRQLQADISNMEGNLNGAAPSQNTANQEADLAAARQALAEEQALLEANRQSLSEYQTASRELVGNVANANRAVTDLSQGQIGVGSTFEQVYGSLQPLTTRLGELEDRMYELALAGQRDTEEFRELQAEAIRMRQTIQEVDASVDTMAKRSGRLEAYISVANGLVGAFTAAQGAVALFAGENEEMNEVLTRVMSAMAILQGIQATLEIFNKENAASILFTSTARANEAQSTTLQTAASNLHAVALNAEAAAQAAVTAATVADTVATQARAAATAAEALATAEATASDITRAAATAAATVAELAETEALNANTAAVAAQTAATEALAAAETAAAGGAASNTAAQGAQTVAMTASSVAAGVLGFALKAIGIGLIITAVAALVEYWDELTDAMKKLLPAGTDVGKMFDKIKSYAFGVGEAILKFLINPFKAAWQAINGDFKGAWETAKAGFDVVTNYTKGVQRQDLRNQEKYLQEKEQKEIDAQKRDLERRKNRGQDVYKQEQELFKRQIELNKKTREDNAETIKAMEDAQDKRYAEDARKREAARKKAEQDAKAAAQKAKQEAEKAAAEKKRNEELVAKYTNEIRKLSLADTEDLLVRERDAIYLDMQNRLADLKRDNAKTAEAKKKQKELEESIEWEANVRIKEVTERHNREMAAIKLESLKLLNDLSKESRATELEALKIESQQQEATIRERYGKDYLLREYLVLKNAQALAEKEKEVNLKYDQEQINKDLEKAQIMLELAQNHGKMTAKQEEQNQLAILQVQAEAAQKQLDLLIESGKSEDDILVLQARLKVKKMRDAIEDEAKKGKKFDMFEWLGIGTGWTGEQRAAIESAASDLLSNISQITDGLIEQYQRQIDKKQEVIDQYNTEIDDLEGQLDEEKNLRDQGLANNYENIQKELAAKKAQRDEEIRQQKEMVKKQEEVKKAQMAVDTAVQLVNMITSATNIFNSLSGIPFVGVPIAIALIATMFGAFAMAKAKAYQSIKSGQQYEQGGWIDGYSHAHGGTKYYNPDGDVKELEKGEYVVRRKSATKYSKLLEAINTGNFDNLSFNDLGTMGLFDAMGINFETAEVKQSVKDDEYIKAIVNNFSFAGHDSYDFSNMDANISYLADRKREEVERWDDNHYYYVKRGSKITKTAKK